MAATSSCAMRSSGRRRTTCRSRRGSAPPRPARLRPPKRRRSEGDMKTTVKNLNNEDVGEIELDDAVFAVPVRADLLARMVNYQLAKRRAGTHKTKGVGEIRGTTKKPYRQKGTGR